MAARLIISFDRLGDADLLAKAGFIDRSLTGNPNFQSWSDLVPSLQRLHTTCAAFGDAYYASQSRDIAKVNLRNEARAELVKVLREIAPFLELAARGDTNILISTGYDLRRPSVRNVNTGKLPAPEGFRVEQSTENGTLTVRASRLSGAQAYEVQVTQGDPHADDGWGHALTSTTVQRIRLDGLKSGRTWVRMRGVGGNGGGEWAAPVSALVG